MNKHRRQTLSKIIDAIEALNAQIENIKNEVDNIRDQLDTERDNEQESFDNLPESLQQSERGQDMEAAIEQLDMASTSISDLYDALDQFGNNDTVGNIDEARGQG